MYPINTLLSYKNFQLLCTLQMSVMSARARKHKKPSIFSYHKIVSSTVMANMYAVCRCIYVVVDRQAGDITFQLYIKFFVKNYFRVIQK
jgi:hypothetical protein